MAVETRYLCDCCGGELGSSGLTEAATISYLDAQGSAHTMLFCLDNDCGPRLIDAAAAQRKADHARRKNAVPDLPKIARRPEHND